MHIMDREELSRRVPAAFAAAPAPHVSERYGFIPTTRIIDALAEQGWFPVRAMQSFSKRLKSIMHATHQIVFRHAAFSMPLIKVGDIIPEISLVNNHMAQRIFRFFAGFMRLACLNGLVVPLGMARTEQKRKHIGDALPDVHRALQDGLQTLNAAATEIEAWKQIQLDIGQRLAFAKQAYGIRRPDLVLSDGFNASDLLRPRRDEDVADDLWTVFNRVQENLTVGGVRINYARRNLRGLTSVDKTLNVNERLWALARWYAMNQKLLRS